MADTQQAATTWAKVPAKWRKDVCDAVALAGTGGPAERAWRAAWRLLRAAEAEPKRRRKP